MKILITGAAGMLGTQVVCDLQRGYTELGKIPQVFEGAQLLLADLAELDITDEESCEKYMAEKIISKDE